MGHFIFSLIGLKRILFTNVLQKLSTPHLVLGPEPCTLNPKLRTLNLQSPKPYCKLYSPVLGFRVQGLGFRVQGLGFRVDPFESEAWLAVLYGSSAAMTSYLSMILGRLKLAFGYI